MKNFIKEVLGWIGNIWASPVTVCNVIFSLACGAKIVSSAGGVIELLASSNGPQANFFRTHRFAAYTCGTSIVYRDRVLMAKPRLRRHEMRHILQFQIFGVSMVILYPLASLIQRIRGKHAYSDNFFELDAKRHES